MGLLARMRRGFSIKWRIMLLTSGVVFITVAFLSTIALDRFQTVVLEKTLDVCRNLSANIANVAREELLINEIFDATRTAVRQLHRTERPDGQEQHVVTGLLNSYVISIDSRIVAHTDEAKIGTEALRADAARYRATGRLTHQEITLDGIPVVRFAYPIFIYYQGKPIRVGTGVFEFDRREMDRPIAEMRSRIILAALILLLAALLVSFGLSMRLTRPIASLAAAVEQVAEGDLGIQVDIRTGGEIGQLAAHFNDMSSKLAEAEIHRQEHERVKLQQAGITRELEIAKGIQLAVLPRDGLFGPYTFIGYMQTAEEVGGDYYDCIEVKHGKKSHYWFFVGDVSGHGLQSGLTMLMAQTAIQSALELRPDLTPAQSVTAVNRVLYANINRLKERKYMTASFFRADESGRFLTAGLHQDILVYRARRKVVERIPSDGMWLGVEEDIESVTKDSSFKLGAGDVLFLFTDGITEAVNATGDMFGDERLIEVIERYGHLDVQTLKNNLLDDLYGHMGTVPTRDDITFAVIRRA